jgi:hypothetical protein
MAQQYVISTIAGAGPMPIYVTDFWNRVIRLLQPISGP